ncbi:hypothetical protein CYMTET_31853 [Cymbomonas tetramitiformis]|uniref:EF-hand domain-containing protein n=1 Tax=Cymbomonas tetramitiformis TaxID=36881 RepID=A0AAE0C0Y8_9CHLO|nr:hypothetical protein CYMTET_44585 [Cymbomonas tetramitiformis]KAK3259193.1 hypothetical protein CYMTET_31853 [Cymbomonas tetramitiformis]
MTVKKSAQTVDQSSTVNVHFPADAVPILEAVSPVIEAYQMQASLRAVVAETQLDEFKANFDIFDADKDGYITVSDLGSVFQRLGQNLNYDRLKQMVNELDVDGSGTINFSEFLSLVTRKDDTIPRIPNLQDGTLLPRLVDFSKYTISEGAEVRHALIDTLFQQHSAVRFFDFVAQDMGMGTVQSSASCGGRVAPNARIRTFRAGETHVMEDPVEEDSIAHSTLTSDTPTSFIYTENGTSWTLTQALLTSAEYDTWKSLSGDTHLNRGYVIGYAFSDHDHSISKKGVLYYQEDVDLFVPVGNDTHHETQILELCADGASYTKKTARKQDQ